MSGDVQPRKRKDKRRKKDVSNIQPEYTAQKIRGFVEETVDDVGSNFPSEENIHIHKDDGTGGNMCSKIVFFFLLGVLAVMVGLILTEYRGLSDLDAPVSESRWGPVFHGWVDEVPSKHDDEPAEVEESEEHEGASQEEEHSAEEEHDEQEELDEPASGEDQDGVSGEEQEQSQEEEAEDESQPEESEEVGEGEEEEEDGGEGEEEEDGGEEEEEEEGGEQEVSEEELNDIPGITESAENNDGDEAEDQSQAEEEEEEEEGEEEATESAEAGSKEDLIEDGEADESPEDIQKSSHSPVHTQSLKNDTKKVPVLSSKVPERTENYLSGKNSENIASKQIYKVTSPELKSDPQVQKSTNANVEKSVIAASSSNQNPSSQDISKSVEDVHKTENISNLQTKLKNPPGTAPIVESTKTVKLSDKVMPRDTVTEPIDSSNIIEHKNIERKPSLSNEEFTSQTVKVDQYIGSSKSLLDKPSVQGSKVAESVTDSKPAFSVPKITQPVKASECKDTPDITVPKVAQPVERRSKDSPENIIPKVTQTTKPLKQLYSNEDVRDSVPLNIQKNSEKVNVSPSLKAKESFGTESRHIVKSETVEGHNVKSSTVHESVAKNDDAKTLSNSEKRSNSKPEIVKSGTIPTVPKTTNFKDTLEPINTQVPKAKDQTQGRSSNSARVPNLEKERIAEVDSILHQDFPQMPVTVPDGKPTTIVGATPQMKESSKSTIDPQSSQHGMVK